jgi:hypothetical protein
MGGRRNHKKSYKHKPPINNPTMVHMPPPKRLRIKSGILSNMAIVNIPPTPPPEIQTVKLVRGLLASGAGALFFGAIWAWCTMAGIVDVYAARYILLFAWIVGIAGTILSEYLWGKPLKHKFLINILAGLALAVALHYLDNYALKLKAKADTHKINSEPPKFPTASEIADELEKRRNGNVSVPTPTVTPLPHNENPSQEFSLEIENSGLMSDNREWGNGFWVIYPSQGGPASSPVNVALFLRFVNLRAVPVHIDSYEVAIQFGRKWIPLTRLPIKDEAIYGAYPSGDRPSIDEALKHASRLDFEEWALDSQLSSMNATIKANDMVRGWAFYEYPPAISHVSGKEPIRVTVTDVQGNISRHIHYKTEEEVANKNRTLGQLYGFTPGKFEDISGVRRRHWDGQP